MENKQKIIFVCTGNSCRSQIAEGMLRNMTKKKFYIFSAGSHPSQVHPNAIAVMSEIGINIANHRSNHIDDYIDKGINIVITVCDNASRTCPIFPGETERIHWSIKDPFEGWDYAPSQLDNFRLTRDNIKDKIKYFLIDF